MKKWEREVRALAKLHGAFLEKGRRSSHYMLHLPNGQKVTVPSTPSDIRTMRNVTAETRRKAALP